MLHPRLGLILSHIKNDHVGSDTVSEFENVILSKYYVYLLKVKNKRTIDVSMHLWSVINKLNKKANLRLKPIIPMRMLAKDSDFIFSVLMGLDIQKVMPYFMFQEKKSIYLFDSWPDTYEQIHRIVEDWNLQHVFMSSSQSVKELNSSRCTCIYTWIPEGVDPSRYKYYPVKEKNIDVIQIGRKYDAYHERIVNTLEKARKVYLYEKVKGEIIFPRRDMFIDGLARSKISICVPSSITHPLRSGHIETMTARYLQSMVSKCLIVGHAPKEMIDLFEYNPVVEIDMNAPVEQLLFLLEHFQDYIPLIENNYRITIEKHTWSKRWDTIAAILLKGLNEKSNQVSKLQR